MVTFRIAITAAVMAFIIVLAACLIFIQIATFRGSARAAASAALDAASANTLSRLEADVTELSSLLRVLATNPSLTENDDRSEVDGAIVMFKAALHELTQADSLHIGYENGYWLQVRPLAKRSDMQAEGSSTFSAQMRMRLHRTRHLRHCNGPAIARGSRRRREGRVPSMAPRPRPSGA